MMPMLPRTYAQDARAIAQDARAIAQDGRAIAQDARTIEEHVWKAQDRAAALLASEENTRKLPIMARYNLGAHVVACILCVLCTAVGTHA